MRVAGADAVVVGKVTKIADKAVPAERFKGDTGKYQIATVKVEETLFGKGVKEVKVAFPEPVAGPGPGGIIRPGRRPMVKLTLNQEAALFLTKHPTKDYYTINMYFDVINKSFDGKENPQFKKDMEEVKKAAKLLAKPIDSLKSKNAEDRLKTAAMLIRRYRTPKGGEGEPKTVEIPAEESKLILLALANADWKAAGGPGGWQMGAQGAFQQLGLGLTDEWMPPKDFKEFPEEAKKWLKAHAEKYRIKKYVAAKTKEKAKD
jgi:hypothetical protein